MFISRKAKCIATVATDNLQNLKNKIVNARRRKSEPIDDREGIKGRSLVFLSSASFDDIEIQERVIEEPKEKEIRVNVKFAGLNFLDILKKQGLYPGTEQFPFVSGVEASGIVDALGPNVKGFKIGDRVLAIKSHGCFSDYVCVNEDHCIGIPDDVTLEDAASLFLNYVTAYDLLFRLARVKQNEIILLPQASGGVGNAVIQLSKRIPDVTIIALSSQSKHAYLKSLGVQHCIDYQKQNYVDEVRKISPQGVDVVLDSLNGQDAVNAFGLLRPYGRVIHYGAASISGEHRSLLRNASVWWNSLSMNSLKIINTNKMIGGYNLNYIMKDAPNIAKSTMTELVEMLSRKELKPKLDSIFPLSQGKDAVLRMVRRENIGKVLLSTTAEKAVFIDDDSTLPSNASF